MQRVSIPVEYREEWLRAKKRAADGAHMQDVDVEREFELWRRFQRMAPGQRFARGRLSTGKSDFNIGHPRFGVGEHGADGTYIWRYIPIIMIGKRKHRVTFTCRLEERRIDIALFKDP